MAGTVDTQATNMNEFIRTRLALSPEQANRMITHHAVVRHYVRLVEREYPKVEALEEALTEVFAGGMTRPMRVYRTLATEDNVERVEAFIRGEQLYDEDALEVPDLIELKQLLRNASNIAELANLLVAERAGQNAEGKPRGAVVKLLSTKIRELTAPEGERASKATAAEIEDLNSDE